jgi:4-aminobutyrate aminotransferase-like enzyme/Ser/Thr protein kinase RdoA (MazF antagonist)
MLADAPSLDADLAAKIARDHFGVSGIATPLPSERDQNFLVETPGGERIVLKIANASESRGMLAAQQAAMAHVAARGAAVPRVIAATNGETQVEVSVNGRRHLVWAITWIDAVTLATASWRSADLLEDLGRNIGTLRRALSDFDHPAIHRDFYWDLANAGRTATEHCGLVTEADVSDAINVAIRQFNEHTAPLLPALRRAAVHGDLNDHNVLVSRDGDPEQCHQRVVGFVDFGDMIHSYAMSDLAIALAYMMLDSDDPLGAATRMVRGHHAVSPLDESEIAALFGLAVIRLCASACIAARQRRENPGNEYLGVSQRAIQRTLPRLAATPFPVAAAVLRKACGLSSSRNEARALSYLLEANSAAAAPVLGIDLRREPNFALDLSITSPWLSVDTSQNAEPELTRRLFDKMREAGVRVAVGGYNEARLLYLAPAFAGRRASDERRTVHLGVDLFAAAGTPVFAPIAGIVHTVHDNAAPQDYGPVIILRHPIGGGEDFYTLYGHLSRESLSMVTPGQSVVAGRQIATLGGPDVNGGWTPHLHFQVIADLLGLGYDFPGVALASQRDAWLDLCPDPNPLLGVPADHQVSPARETQATLADRRVLLPRNISVAYRAPLKIVRGWMQYLLDDSGRKYLDAYNNVPHVGHCHPRVVEAGIAQMRLLNTNTRYLSDALTEYAKRLTETLPDPLRVCVFVNSASEANELALRMSRAHTGGRDMIVLESAYHGNTTALIDLSPYKHAGPGGSGAPDWVHVAPLPDDYRGPYKRHDSQAGRKYAAHVSDIITRIAERGRRLGGFIAETCPSVGGQIILPTGYLRAVYRAVRAAGGACIADEVQTGLGRMGTHFWAFEAQGVVPDIVVMGKPLGNGHPIAAVVTTREIADSFDTGMEFFSTFGGNNVSCAIGLAVLDVMRDEHLQKHALDVGARLRSTLEALSDRHSIIGDVRGSGLFLGVELVRDRETLEPAGAEASFVANRMREMGVLLGTDGPHHNVVKIRPPMPFDDTNADLLIETFESALRALPGRG